MKYLLRFVECFLSKTGKGRNDEENKGEHVCCGGGRERKMMIIINGNHIKRNARM